METPVLDVKVKSPITRSVFEIIHDVSMSRVPELGYDSFAQWVRPPWNVFIIGLTAFFSSMILSASWFSVVWEYPSDLQTLSYATAHLISNATDPLLIAIHQTQLLEIQTKNVVVQAMVIFLSLLMVRFCFVKFTGEAQDAYLTTTCGFSEMILHPKYAAESNSEEAKNRLTVLLKMLILLIFFLLGWYAGCAITIGWARTTALDDSFTIENCDATNYTSVPCRIFPRFDESKISSSSALWLVFLGNLLNFASYYMAYTLIRHKEPWMSPATGSKKKRQHSHKNVNALGFAMVAAMGPALAHILFAKHVGVSHNVFFWIVSVTFSGSTQQASTYAWAGMVIGIIIVVSHMIYSGLWSLSKRQNLKKTEYHTL